jgi:large subunit ribosomal protein L28
VRQVDVDPALYVHDRATRHFIELGFNEGADLLPTSVFWLCYQFYPVSSIMFSTTIQSVSRATLFKRATPLPAIVGSPLLESVRHRSNRSRRGLYDGKDIRFGNNVSHSERKTRRSFKPNVFIKRVYSEVLDEMVQFHLTAATLRSIDKVGGLDNYLLKSKHVTEGEGLVVKKRILETLEQGKLAEVEIESPPDKMTKNSEMA